jgi:ribosomal protein L11 methylase PrmA
VIAAIVWLLVGGLAFYLFFFIFFPLARGAIYDPSTPVQTSLMVDLAGVLPGEKAVDLGSGDGRVLIALARRGAEAHGYEVNPVLVLLSRRNIRRAGLEGKAFAHWGSFWRVDLSRFGLVTVFQVDFVMGRLETKLKRELADGARIVSHHWRFPDWPPETAQGDMYRYRVE